MASLKKEITSVVAGLGLAGGVGYLSMADVDIRNYSKDISEMAADSFDEAGDAYDCAVVETTLNEVSDGIYSVVGTIDCDIDPIQDLVERVNSSDQFVDDGVNMWTTELKDLRGVSFDTDNASIDVTSVESASKWHDFVPHENFEDIECKTIVSYERGDSESEFNVSATVECKAQ